MRKVINMPIKAGEEGDTTQDQKKVDKNSVAIILSEHNFVG